MISFSSDGQQSFDFERTRWSLFRWWSTIFWLWAYPMKLVPVMVNNLLALSVPDEACSGDGQQSFGFERTRWSLFRWWSSIFWLWAYPMKLVPVMVNNLLALSVPDEACSGDGQQSFDFEHPMKLVPVMVNNLLALSVPDEACSGDGQQSFGFEHPMKLVPVMVNNLLALSVPDEGCSGDGQQSFGFERTRWSLFWWWSTIFWLWAYPMKLVPVMVNNLLALSVPDEACSGDGQQSFGFEHPMKLVPVMVNNLLALSTRWSLFRWWSTIFWLWAPDEACSGDGQQSFGFERTRWSLFWWWSTIFWLWAYPMKLVLVMVNNLLALSVPDEACSGDGQQSFGFERTRWSLFRWWSTIFWLWAPDEACSGDGQQSFGFEHPMKLVPVMVNNLLALSVPDEACSDDGQQSFGFEHPMKLVPVMVNNLLALSVPDEACSGDGQQSFGFERTRWSLFRWWSTIFWLWAYPMKLVPVMVTNLLALSTRWSLFRWWSTIFWLWAPDEACSGDGQQSFGFEHPMKLVPVMVNNLLALSVPDEACSGDGQQSFGFEHPMKLVPVMVNNLLALSIRWSLFRWWSTIFWLWAYPVKLVLVMVNNLLALSVPDEACSGDGQQSFGFERTWWSLFRKRAVCIKLDIYVCIPMTLPNKQPSYTSHLDSLNTKPTTSFGRYFHYYCVFIFYMSFKYKKGVEMIQSVLNQTIFKMKK